MSFDDLNYGDRFYDTPDRIVMLIKIRSMTVPDWLFGKSAVFNACYLSSGRYDMTYHFKRHCVYFNNEEPVYKV